MNMTTQLGDLIRDTASIELDRGILYGHRQPPGAAQGWWPPRLPPMARTWPPR